MSAAGREAQPGPATYTRDAYRAITRAARHEHDFAGWLAAVLCAAAEQAGDLTAGRPGSWEAALVDQLVDGTCGGNPAGYGAWARGRSAPGATPGTTPKE